MTRILDDVKLDFKDVLILPKRSELTSRSQVELSRTFAFKNSNATWKGIGVIASNMDHLITEISAEVTASEGRVLSVPYKGSIHPIIQDLLGSLRSTCTYVGAKTLKELPKRTTFVRVHNQIAALYGMGELMS